MRLAYAGSFNPITKGHMHIIEKAFRLGRAVELVVLVANNPEKKYAFSLEERLRMVERSLAEARIMAEVYPLSGEEYTVHAALRHGCTAMLRGIRTEGDFQEEIDLYHANKRIDSSLETVYVMPDLDLSAVRSSAVMGMIGPRRWTWAVGELVNDVVMNELCRRWCYAAAGVEDSAVCDAAYAGPAYHGWRHIAYCLAELPYVASYLRDTPDRLPEADLPVLRRAILYHDATDPATVDETVLRKEHAGGLPESGWAQVAELIRATAHDSHGHLSAYGKVIHDIDLSVLAWPAERYRFYQERVYREYLQERKVPPEQFYPGRRDFLQRLREAPVFELGAYPDAVAYENIDREIRELRQRVG